MVPALTNQSSKGLYTTRDFQSMTDTDLIYTTIIIRRRRIVMIAMTANTNKNNYNNNNSNDSNYDDNDDSDGFRRRFVSVQS